MPPVLQRLCTPIPLPPPPCQGTGLFWEPRGFILTAKKVFLSREWLFVGTERGRRLLGWTLGADSC